MPGLKSALFAPLALGLTLSACTRPDEAVPTAAPGESPEWTAPEIKDPAFAKEAAAIKDRKTGLAETKAALRELTERFGYPVLPAETTTPPAESGGDSPALGKTAASVYYQVKSVNIVYHFANTMVISVPAGSVLDVVGNQEEPGADPVVVGFYKTTSSPNPAAYRIKVIGINDDRAYGDPNARFFWTNNTGATQSVRVVCFSFPGTGGYSTLGIRLMRPPITDVIRTSKKWVSGWTEETNFEPETDCAGPKASQLQLKRSYGTPEGTNFGHTLLAINSGTMNGGFIRDTDYKINLDNVLPSGDFWAGNYNFILGYFEGDGYQPDMNSPDKSKLLDQHYGGAMYHGFQIDRYACP